TEEHDLFGLDPSLFGRSGGDIDTTPKEPASHQSDPAPIWPSGARLHNSPLDRRHARAGDANTLFWWEVFGLKKPSEKNALASPSHLHRPGSQIVQPSTTP